MDAPASQLIDLTVNSPASQLMAYLDEVKLLEKELLKEELFRVVQYESCFSNTIVKSDERLDVSIVLFL